jgi:hypothetical protein
MDALRRDDLEQARRTSPEEKLRQTLDAWRTGVRLKRTALRLRHPNASDDEIEAMLDAWVAGT